MAAACAEWFADFFDTFSRIRSLSLCNLRPLRLALTISRCVASAFPMVGRLVGRELRRDIFVWILAAASGIVALITFLLNVRNFGHKKSFARRCCIDSRVSGVLIDNDLFYFAVSMYVRNVITRREWL